MKPEFLLKCRFSTNSLDFFNVEAQISATVSHPAHEEREYTAGSRCFQQPFLKQQAVY